MPVRSNEFQRLIYLLHHQLHDRAIVVESAMVPDCFGGSEQEVDVLIEEPVGMINMLIGIECRDRSRPASIEWVQQMRGKHEHRTDKLVLVSRSGFTRGGLEEAEKYGIEVMDLGEAYETDWNVVVNKLEQLFVGQFSFNISKGHAVLEDNGAGSDDPEISAAEPLYPPDGTPPRPVGEVARENLREPHAARELMNLFYQNKDQTRATVTLETPGGYFLVDTSGAQRRVKAIRLEVECDLRMTPISLQHGTVGTAHVAWGRTTNGDDELFLVASEQQWQRGRSALRIASKDQQTEVVIHLTDDSS